MRLPRISSDLRWKRIGPRKWVLTRNGKVFRGDLENGIDWIGVS